MAAPRHPTTQYLAGSFVLSAGSVLFRRRASTNTLEICILHQLTRDEWLLPKGRKDRGETIEQAAVRETYEETGYVCALWPQRMPTRATVPGVSNVHVVEIAGGLVEPIAVTVRDLGSSNSKIIFWYITVVEEGVEKVEGSQMENENFESVFVDVEDAVERLTFQVDREVVNLAIDIVVGGRIVESTSSGTLNAV
ncbi:8-oxo-(d)GTP phosphatase [Psilocybe cubensis]|uniref:Nudix hydrolase domain-containing protein n=2 Tax=Psilocybe cubensis TaxID=181762 RepID=A0A8H7XK08_PSICU|nr:8-oxo-(d)GTP phosphatase [Psilocybe cubensis]KAH9476490.1 8-oxo-(d)GTP phosphatase [Psilocybe cubensis]